MNKQFITLIFSCITLFGNFGCITSRTWEEHDGLIKTHTKEQKILDDKIIAFGRANNDSSQVARGSVVMMGEQLWYVIPPEQAQNIMRILQTKLPKPFAINEEKGFHVKSLDDKSQFVTYFYLAYSPKNAQEKAKLSALGFNEKSDHYAKSLEVSGNYYTANQSVAPEYHFENPIKLNLYKEIKTTETNFADTAGRVLFTPIALAADVIITPFLILGITVAVSQL